jgi:hypothetical protein
MEAYSPSKALFAARACQAADSGDSDQVEQVIGCTPDRVHTRSDGDLYADVCDLDNRTLVVFRGTATLGGWLVDLAAWQEARRGLPGKVHHGFADSWEELRSWVQVHTPMEIPVEVTGHSLGGALATLAAASLAANRWRVMPVYTFGAPRVGDAEFTAGVDNLVDVWRVVNDIDPVPHVPDGIRYLHCGREWQLPDGGPGSCFGRLRRVVGHARKGVGPLLSDAVNCHLIANYVSALEAALPAKAA